MSIFSQCRSVESVYYLCVLVLAVFLFTVIRYEVSRGLVRAILDHRHRGSYMSAHFLLNLLSEIGKAIKYKVCQAIY